MSVTDIDSSAVHRLAGAHAVYRMFDAGRDLLYVGRTKRGGMRFNEHSEKFWFLLVATITLERYDTEAEAAAAERAAIRAEFPRYNLRGVGDPKQKPWQPAPKITLPVADIAVPDLLSVFEGASRLHWRTITHRLVKRFPSRWGDATGPLVSTQMRALGVPSVSFRESGGGVRYGCHRADVEAAMTRLLQ